MTNQFCKNLTIFEGCDGSGKTVAAKEFAEKTGALYYHFDALDGCENVSQVFIDAMLPALLGVQDVVFDRSWLSEKIYGDVYWKGRDRISWRVPILEMLAMRCGAVVIACDPGFDACKAAFESRPELEMLDDLRQLQEVYTKYKKIKSSLPHIRFNYIKDKSIVEFLSYSNGNQCVLDFLRPANHLLDFKAIGSATAPRFILVDDNLIDENLPYKFPCNNLDAPSYIFEEGGFFSTGNNGRPVSASSCLIVDANQNLEPLKKFRRSKIYTSKQEIADELKSIYKTCLIK